MLEKISDIVYTWDTRTRGLEALKICREFKDIAIESVPPEQLWKMMGYRLSQLPVHIPGTNLAVKRFWDSWFDFDILEEQVKKPQPLLSYPVRLKEAFYGVW